MESLPISEPTEIITDVDPTNISTDESYDLESIPRQFDSPEELEEYVNKLEYFDELLHPIKQKIDSALSINTSIQKFMQFNRELWVINRLLTVQRYLDTPKHLQDWYYRKITVDSQFYEDRVAETLRLSKMGSHMSKEDFSMYKQVFEKLFELHKEKVAKHSSPPITDADTRETSSQ